MRRHPLERPRERGRGRLVAGHEQRHQLVAQLPSVSALALLVAGRQQQREDVVARRRRPGSRRRAADLLVEQLVGLAARGGEARPGAAAVRCGSAVSASISTRRRLPTMSSRRRSGAPSRSSRSRSSTPKTVAHDHLERDRLHARQDREAAPPRPGRHVPLGDLAHHLAVLAHPLAVERRQQQPALAQVLGAVEQQHRARARGSAPARRCPRRRGAGRDRR